MKTLIIAVGCLIGFQVHAQLEANLMSQMKAWRKGDAPPSQLLKFPDGKINLVAACGVRVIGSEVGDYIWQIEDADLLAALMFDSRAQPETFHAASARLISLKGVAHVSGLLAERRKAEPGAFTRSELAVLSQLLRSSYVAIQVARITAEDMPLNEAETALLAMKSDLQTGMSWSDAYSKHSDLHPDTRGRAKDTRSRRTQISYLYASIVSPDGFDIVTYRTAENLPVEHLRKLFRAKQGTHIFKTTEGVYLYHIQSLYYAD